MIPTLILATALAVTPAATPAKAPKPCKDPIIKVIREAGWKDIHQRVAYAVAWRESNHTPSESTYPDLGLYQLNVGAWSGTKYWPANPLDAKQNARAAFRIWKDHGWQPWGLNAKGTGVDASAYAWSSWQIDNWIWRPYVTGLGLYDRLPKACR
jgi:hypothetical protein